MPSANTVSGSRLGTGGVILETDERPARPAVTVVIADDHPLFLSALSSAVQHSPQLELLAMAQSGIEALEAVRRHRPDVTVLDMRMPGMDGQEVLRRLRETDAPTRVLFISEYVAGELVLQALSAGGAGYVPKSATAAEICAAIIKVAEGESVLPTEIAGPARDEPARARTRRRPAHAPGAGGARTDGRGRSGQRDRRIGCSWRCRRSRRTSRTSTPSSASTTAARPSPRRCAGAW